MGPVQVDFANVEEVQHDWLNNHQEKYDAGVWGYSIVELIYNVFENVILNLAFVNLIYLCFGDNVVDLGISRLDSVSIKID